MTHNKLPKDWKIKTLGDILKISSGNGLTKSERNEEGEYLVYGGNGITGKHNEYLFEEEKLIIGRVGAHCGNAYITKPKSWVTDNAFVVSFNDTEVNKKFLLNLIGVLNLNKYSVSTAQPVISQRTIYPIEIILPPLKTQHTIVSKIEELFSELDKGIEDLKTAQLQLKTYRQAVLKYAFEGKLTNKKVKDGVLPKGWERVTIGDVCHNVEYGSGTKSKKKGKIPVLRMGNIQNGIFDWSDLVYSDDDLEIKKYLLKKNDVLFNRTNSAELVGKTAIYKGERPAIFAGYLIRLNRKEELIDSAFITYYLNSKEAKKYGNSVRSFGVNQSNINGTKLKNYPLSLPPIKEQHQIVQEIESRLSVADKMEESIVQSLLKAESLRQSILKKGFSGELV